MKKIDDVYQQGTIAFVEQFCYAEEELRQYVVYTYYDNEKRPLYVGRSRDFYNTHYINQSSHKEFMKDVVYIGFMLMENEEETKDAVKYVIRWREPKYNKKKYRVEKELTPLEDDIVLARGQMEQRWREFVGE
ncbi:hypothetical protein RZ835_017890 [Clostridioides difficile]|nr:hypothetical protein [Clostridioides difficile]